jgi:hypothetical protein
VGNTRCFQGSEATVFSTGFCAIATEISSATSGHRCTVIEVRATDPASICVRVTDPADLLDERQRLVYVLCLTIALGVAIQLNWGIVLGVV